MHHDMAQQGWVNATVLVLPAALCAFSPAADGGGGSGEWGSALGTIECVGWGLWLAAWCVESVADLQKMLFEAETKAAAAAAGAAAAAAAAGAAAPASVAVPTVPKSRGFEKPDRPPSLPPPAVASREPPPAVLGLPPFDGPRYGLWALCRHPNYAAELTAWTGMALAALPSVWATASAAAAAAGRPGGQSGGEGSVAAGEAATRASCLLALLILGPRMMFDCLLWWTGAAPAEHYSALRRPRYQEYQRRVPCLFPPVLGLRFACFCEGSWPHTPSKTE